MRFGVAFIGSRALVGAVDAALLEKKDARGVTVAQAIRDFGLDPSRMPEAVVRGVRCWATSNFTSNRDRCSTKWVCRLVVVEAIAGQTQARVSFRGRANHAGTTPMHLRRDAVAAAAEWILAVEQEARATPGMVATVGKVRSVSGS